MVHRRGSSRVSASLQFEREDTSCGPEFMGVRGSTCSSNDRKGDQTTPEVSVIISSLFRDKFNYLNPGSWCLVA